MSKIIRGGTRIGGAAILADCSVLNVGGPSDTPSVRTSPVARAALWSA
jgi:hypothetical protein